MDQKQRAGLFQMGILKMFLSYNRQVDEAFIAAKTAVTMESLSTLPDGKINEFFKLAREKIDHLPSDHDLITFARDNWLRFKSEAPKKLDDGFGEEKGVNLMDLLKKRLANTVNGFGY